MQARQHASTASQESAHSASQPMPWPTSTADPNSPAVTPSPPNPHRPGRAQLDGQRSVNVNPVWSHVNHPTERRGGHVSISCIIGNQPVGQPWPATGLLDARRGGTLKGSKAAKMNDRANKAAQARGASAPEGEAHAVPSWEHVGRGARIHQVVSICSKWQGTP